MATAVNGNERNPSYDCQWVFNGFGSIGRLVEWSISVLPSGVADPIQGEKNSVDVSILRNYIPKFIYEGVSAFGQGFKRDVKWLCNEPAKENFDFGPDVKKEEDQAQEPTVQKSKVLEAIKKCEDNTKEARRCAQRVALAVVFAVVVLGSCSLFMTYHALKNKC